MKICPKHTVRFSFRLLIVTYNTNISMSKEWKKKQKKKQKNRGQKNFLSVHMIQFQEMWKFSLLKIIQAHNSLCRNQAKNT